VELQASNSGASNFFNLELLERRGNDILLELDIKDIY
jgi:hypothetical protein